MATNFRCGDEPLLRGLLEDTLDVEDQAGLMRHLEGCEACRRAFDALAADGRWRDDLRRFGRTDPGPTAPAVGGGHRADDPAGPDGPDLGFLRPPEAHGELGRFGPFGVLGVLGHGGMGVVLKAFDPALDRLVAVKVLSPQLAACSSARRRFIREARAAASVVHDHVVTIHAVDEAAGLPYLVMQLVVGKSLQERIDRSGPLEPEEILRIGLQIAAGLAAAHAQGLVHRDVKPSNVLLENGVERVKLTDFGLARAVDDASLTQSGVVAGTPQYMAPEQARGEPVDHRSDLFSLGSVLYAMCTGRPPFRADSTMAVLRRVCEDTPRPVREINHAIPEWLEAVVARLHAKDPAARYQSATEVAGLLAQQLAWSRQPRPAPDPAQPVPATAAAKAPRRRGLRPLAAVAGLLALAAAGGAGALGPARIRDLVTTVLRIETTDGVLVLNVADPQARVVVDGGEVVVTGAGVREIRLRPGPHRVRTQRDGEPPSEVEVTIARGGRRDLEIGAGRAGGGAPGRAGSEAPAGAPAAVPEGVTLGEIRRFEGHTDGVACVAFLPDGHHAVSAGDTTLRQWDLATGRELKRYEGHTGAVVYVSVSPDGSRMLSGSGDRTLRLWDVASGRELKRLEGHTHQINRLAISPDGRRAASTSWDKTLRLWDLEAGEELHRVDFDGPSTGVAYSPDGRKLLVASGDHSVRLLDAESAAELRRIGGYDAWVGEAAYAPEGRAIATGGGIPGHGLRLWDLDKWAERWRFVPGSDTGWSIAFTPDGARLVVSLFQDVALVDAATGRELHRYKGHSAQVTCVRVSPDGRRLLSASFDKTVRLWGLPAGQGPS